MTHITTQTLRYLNREDDITTLWEALNCLGHKNVVGAIDILMAYRNNLLESQLPTLKPYDPREIRP